MLWCMYIGYEVDRRSDVPVEATISSNQGAIKVVSWNIGQTDLAYFYHALPKHWELGDARVAHDELHAGTLIKFAADELILAPASLELHVTEESDVIDEKAESEDGRVIATKGTRWVTVGWPANVNAGLAKIFAGGGGGRAGGSRNGGGGSGSGKGALSSRPLSRRPSTEGDEAERKLQRVDRVEKR